MIDLYSESGCGKTFSALLLARGFVGPSGKIAMVDSESGRGSLYADVASVAPYDVLTLETPFSPANYIDAINTVETSGYSLGIIDSASHEWEGIGGVLDMAAENEQKSGRSGLHNWKTPKFEHAKFVQRLMRSSIPWIVCIRAKYKTRQGKDDRGKTCIIKDDYTSPIQAEDFIFESTIHGEIMPDHGFRLTKCSHPDLRTCFPDKGPICIEHGAKLAKWCAAPAGTTTAHPPADTAKALKSKLWAKCLEYVGKDATLADVEVALKAKNVSDKPLKEMTPEEMSDAIDKIELLISDVMP